MLNPNLLPDMSTLWMNPAIGRPTSSIWAAIGPMLEWAG
jgi:hypothetical protein